MNYLRSFMVFSTVLLFTGAYQVAAQSFNWSQNKDEVFRLAKEQDRFILLFVGRSDCPICQRTSDIFTTNYYRTQEGSGSKAGPLKSLIDNNFIPWYSPRNDVKSQADVKIYTAHLDALVEQGFTLTLPFLYVINPDEPEKIAATSWGALSVENLRSLLTFNLLSGSKLEWYEDEETALNLAKEQNKYVFKLIGKGASPNSQQLMKQLNVDPLKKLLENNFILLYINASEANIDIKTLSGEVGTTAKSFPYITIMYPVYPDVMLFESWGIQKTSTMESILKTYPVSNDNILQDNKVNVLNKTLYISNQTNNEQIYIFTLTGKQIASVRKNHTTFQMDVSSFPKGMLVVYSSAGWNLKIVVP